MSIVGIGTDLVQCARIESLIVRFGDKFIARILSPEEQINYQSNANPGFVAKRFAAKEAVAKAFGVGIGHYMAFNEISITNLPNGKPTVNFLGKAHDYVSALKINEVMVTLSDEKDYALAFAIVVRSGTDRSP